MKLKYDVVVILLIAYMWETLEHYLEANTSGAIYVWFAGVEFWGNRLITDPLLVMCGSLFWRKYNFSVFARIFSLVWLTLNIFVFPDCMYIQKEYFPFEFYNLFGNKTSSWFDLWSVEHFVSGITLSSIIFVKNSIDK